MHSAISLRLVLWRLTPFLATIALFPTIWLNIASEWLTFEQDNSHALPAILSALYITLQSRLAPGSTVSKPSSIYIFVLILGLNFASLIFQIVNIQLLSYLTMTCTLFVLMLWLYGVTNLVTVFLITLLVGMSLPFLDSLIEPLVKLASAVVSTFLGLFNITALIEGNLITIPFGKIAIAEGCSGIRYLLISIVLACLTSHVNHYRLMRTIVSIIVGISAGLLINWLRIFLLVLVGYYSDMQSSLMHDHELFGWLVFSAVVFPLIYLAPHSNPVNIHQTKKYNSIPSYKAVAIFLLVISLTNFALKNYFQYSFFRTSDSIEFLVPSQWAVSKMPETLSDTPLQLPKPSKSYRKGDIYIEIYSNVKNSLNEKLVTYTSLSTISEKWTHQEDISLNIASQSYTASIFSSVSSPQTVLKLQAFKTGQYWSGEYSSAKLFQLPALISGNNSYSQFIFSTECTTIKCTNEIKAVTRALQQVVG